MTPFSPYGDRARWRMVYDLLAVTPVGGTVTYNTLAELLELDPKKDRPAIRKAVRRAGHELETVDKHAIDAVTNVGYRIVRPEEHLGLARRHQVRAGRELANGHSKVTNVDLNGLDPTVRRGFEVVALAFAAQQDTVRRLDVRQKNMESALSSMASKTERTAEDVAALRGRLERLERRRQGSEGAERL